MGQCQYCHCELGSCDPREFCSEECSEGEDVDMDLSQVPTHDLVNALQDRNDVEYIINARSSRSYVVALEDGEIRTGQGEVIVLIVKGLY